MKTLVRTALCVLALSAGALAAVARIPQPPLAADEVSALQLAEWIRARHAGLRVIDTRAAEANEADRLPGARSAADIDVDAFDAGDTLVVYADRRVDEAAIEALNRRAHPRRVLRLQGGIEAWNADVLFPVIRDDASERERREFASRAELSRYFGGAPRVLEPGAAPSRNRSRRGC